ncbi:MAG TPA: hypothetical protein VLD55_04935 [Candidatus Sulfobium mesophilum]|nr:hypothetical protein [Candidatus Sulfobium mesophilum]
MKKILVIMIVLMATAIAAPAFAVTLISSPTGTNINGVSYIPSTGVSVVVSSDDTNYAATSAHASSATSAGFEFQMWNTDNGIWKKAWVNQAANAAGATTSTWPDPVTGPTTTVSGFQK